MDSAPEVPAEDGPIGKIRAFFDNAAWQHDVFPLLSSWEGVLFIFLFCSQLRLLRLWTWVTTCFKNVPSRPKWPRWDATHVLGSLALVCGMFAELFVLSFCSFHLEVIDELVTSRAPPIPGRIPTTLIPTENESSFWLALDRFDYSKDSKNGCQGLETKKIVWGVFKLFDFGKLKRYLTVG